ncbi:CRISPR system precrRNA processing endoribonuclease RAMP protein Cas6 [Nocardia nova]
MPALIEFFLDHPPDLDTYPARLHGAACALLETPSTDHSGPVKHFSTAPLVFTPYGTRWRLGWLDAGPPPSLPSAVRFGETVCAVVDQRIGVRSYHELASLAAPARSVQFSVGSPMYFSRNGRDHPLPDPVLVARSLVTRWNRHAPEEVRIEDATVRDLLQHLYLSDFEGHTVRARATYSSQQTGFLGAFTLALPAAAPQATYHVLAALARYAEIAGIGAQTTHGYGACTLTGTTAPGMRRKVPKGRSG